LSALFNILLYLFPKFGFDVMFISKKLVLIITEFRRTNFVGFRAPPTSLSLINIFALFLVR